MTAAMNPDQSVVNGAERRMHPHVLSFVSSALFGAACIFVFMFCPSLLAADTPAAINPPQQSATPTESPSSPLLIPVVGIKASQLEDTYADARSQGRTHIGIDIMAACGTNVIAVDDGTVAKLFYSKQGGLTVYQLDPTKKFIYYYAHLESYAPGLVEGKQLKRGDLIGMVGFSGNASEAAPHLHFEISVLGPEKLWWKSTAINPCPVLRGH